MEEGKEKEENNQEEQKKGTNNNDNHESEENKNKEEQNKENKIEKKETNNKDNIEKTNEENNILEKKQENSDLYVESTEPFMQVATKELIPCLNDPDNRKCYDCQATPANWVCVNNGIFLCCKCAGEHRGYGAIISNLKFIMLDKLNEFQIELMKRGGNKKLDKLLEEYKIDKNKIDKLLLYSSRLLEYHRDYLYNKLAGKDDPKPPTKFDSNKVMNNFKDNPRPPLEKVKTKDEIFKDNDNNKEKNDGKKGNCKVQ
jgi:hypothetical protein